MKITIFQRTYITSVGPEGMAGRQQGKVRRINSGTRSRWPWKNSFCPCRWHLTMEDFLSEALTLSVVKAPPAGDNQHSEDNRLLPGMLPRVTQALHWTKMPRNHQSRSDRVFSLLLLFQSVICLRLVRWPVSHTRQSQQPAPSSPYGASQAACGPRVHRSHTSHLNLNILACPFNFLCWGANEGF